MKRKHTVLEYKNMITKVRKIRPEISITSDFIIGYPGESNTCFEETLDLIEQIGFDDGYSFIYSKRPGTPASSEPDDVTLAEKKKRLSLVQNLIRENSKKYLSKLVGTNQEVLIEGISKTDSRNLYGRTLTNKTVSFKGERNLIGQLVNINITKANRASLEGTCEI